MTLTMHDAATPVPSAPGRDASAACAAGSAHSMAAELRLHPEGDAGRAEVEAFIRSVYAERFGAELTAFAPVLVSLRDEQGLVAAAGYRPAEGGPLFLERYLGGPVEALLCPGEATLRRETIVEVGHLAAVRSGAGRCLIQRMAPLLAAQGFHWVVATFTEELRHLFLRLGIAPLALGTARPERLGDEAARWGRYYQHRPVVLAGHLQQALRRFNRLKQPGAGTA